MITKICLTCGKKFSKSYYNSKKYWETRKYCSKKCFGLSEQNKILKKCLQCGKKFLVSPCKIKIGKGKFCSRKCYNISMKGQPAPKTAFRKGNIPWIKGKHHTEKSKKKMSKIRLGQYTEEKHPRWKGGKVSYSGLHHWAKKYKPKPKLCEICHQKKKLELANKDHKYKRNLNDFMWICRFCHRQYDYKYNLKPDNKIGNNQFKTIS